MESSRLVPEWVPDACTLPTAQQQLRVTDFDDFFATSVTSVSRLAPEKVTFALRADEATAAEAAELVVRETACCSFFTFVLTATAGSLSLSVSAPQAHVEVLDALVARADVTVK